MLTNQKPLLVAHRGANRYAPENTLPAFEKAIELGADGVEFDVQMTLDGILVVCHNFTVDKTSNGSGPIEAMTFQELRNLDFGSWYGPEYQGTKIPTLAEVLEVVQDMKWINIEIKRPRAAVRREIVTKILAVVNAFGISDKTVISSFDYPVLGEVKRQDPDQEIGMLYSVLDRRKQGMEGLRFIGLAKRYKSNALHPTYDYALKPLYIFFCKINRIEINCWGVQRADHMKYVMKRPIHAVITDYLEW